MTLDAIARMKRRIAKRQEKIDSRKHLPSYTLKDGTVHKKYSPRTEPSRMGEPWYEFPCSLCTFRGITQGALEIHIRLKHFQS